MPGVCGPELSSLCSLSRTRRTADLVMALLAMDRQIARNASGAVICCGARIWRFPKRERYADTSMPCVSSFAVSASRIVTVKSKPEWHQGGQASRNQESLTCEGGNPVTVYGAGGCQQVRL